MHGHRESDTDAVRVLYMPRGRSAVILVAALVFVGVGFLVLDRNALIACLAFILGGAGCVVAILELILPSWLRLEPAGFTIWRAARPARTWSWADSGPFATVQVSGRQSLVGFRAEGKRVAGSSGSGSRSEKYLSPGYGGLTAPELAELMNQYRARAAR